jgi:hypothetical protein
LESLGEEGLIGDRGNLGGIVGVELGLQEAQYHVGAKIPMRTVSQMEEREVDGERVRTKALESVEERSFDPPLKVRGLVEYPLIPYLMNALLCSWFLLIDLLSQSKRARE